MRFQLPASRTKHYLSGMDWMIQALDRNSRKQFQCGTSFMIAAELSGAFDAEAFEKAFTRYCLSFPQLNGVVSRDWNLAPYWVFPKVNTLRPHEFKTTAVSGKAEALRVLEAELNRVFPPGTLPVKICAAKTENHFFLGFIFDHRFFDARGAEQFLSGFQKEFLLKKESSRGLRLEEAGLDRWAAQFEAGKKVNRAQIARKKGALRYLETIPGSEKAVNRFKVKSFTSEETREIMRRSEETAGPFMFVPYALSFAVRAMHDLFLARGKRDGDLIVPVTRDMRESEDSFRVLFNHLSFLFFRISPKEAENPPELLKSLKTQMYEQIKQKMPEALVEASMLMRIVPRSILADSLSNSGRPDASFSFASLGESAYSQNTLTNARVENMIHMPRIPFPPGAGIFLSQYQGQLNVTLSYLDSLMTEAEADQVLQRASSL